MSIPIIMAALMGGVNNDTEKKQEPSATKKEPYKKIKLSVFFNNESLSHSRVLSGREEVDRIINIFMTKGVTVDEKGGKTQTKYPSWSINKFVIEEIEE